jgi:hypothetical protein
MSEDDSKKRISTEVWVADNQQGNLLVKKKELPVMGSSVSVARTLIHQEFLQALAQAV